MERERIDIVALIGAATGNAIVRKGRRLDSLVFAGPGVDGADGLIIVIFNGDGL